MAPLGTVVAVSEMPEAADFRWPTSSVPLRAWRNHFSLFNLGKSEVAGGVKKWAEATHHPLMETTFPATLASRKSLQACIMLARG
jgi:hypothetical protein